MNLLIGVYSRPQARYQDFTKEGELNRKLKYFCLKNVLFWQCTEKTRATQANYRQGVCDFLAKNSRLALFGSHFVRLELLGKTKLLNVESHLK